MKKYFSVILFFTVVVISSECIALENKSIMKRLAEQSEKINKNREMIEKGDLSQCVNDRGCNSCSACKTCSGGCKLKAY